MANAASEGSGVRNERTGTNTRPPRARARSSRARLSEWTPTNEVAGQVLAEPRFGGLGGPKLLNKVGWGEAEPTNRVVLGGLGPSVGSPGFEHRPDEEEQDQIAEQRAAELTAKNRRDRKQALQEEDWKPTTERMTWADYNKLTPEQKAAVDFNTMLVRAVRKDKKMNNEYPEPSSDQEDFYEKALEKTFGNEDRGSKLYAPETMGLLRKIGYQDNAGDLDDFLKLKTAITAEDLKDLPTVEGVPQAVAYSGQAPERTEELSLKRGLATSTADMEQEIARGNQIMATIFQTGAVAGNNDIVRNLGGTPTQVQPKGLGWLEPKYITGESGEQEPGDTNTFFQVSFEKLANTAFNDKRDQILKDINSVLTPEQYNQFLNYADTRSRYAAQYGRPLGDSSGVKYRTAGDFRDYLGMRGGTGGQAQR